MPRKLLSSDPITGNHAALSRAEKLAKTQGDCSVLRFYPEAVERLQRARRRAAVLEDYTENRAADLWELAERYQVPCDQYESLLREMCAAALPLMPEVAKQLKVLKFWPAPLSRDFNPAEFEDDLAAIMAEARALSVGGVAVESHEGKRRLEVFDNGGSYTAILDGTTLPLSMPQHAYLSNLLKANGGWYAPAKNSGERPDKIRKNLPPALQSIIESADGKGSRLTIL